MVKKPLILSSVLIITISFLTFLFFAFAVRAQSPLSLMIIVGQDGQYNLSVKKVQLMPLYPSDYKINYANNYYLVTILTDSGEELFSGKVSHTTIIYPLPVNTGSPIPALTIKPMDEISVYLPYFVEAAKVVFKDDLGKIKLEINLHDYDLTNPGDGITPQPTPINEYVSPIAGTPSCDLCGYCIGGEKPKNWDKCQACTSKEGKFWTSIGCVSFNASGFVQEVLSFILSIIGGLVLLGMLFGGFRLLTSRGDLKQLERGRNIVIGSIGALLIIIFAIFLLRFVGYEVFGIPKFGK